MDKIIVDIAKTVFGKDISEKETSFNHKSVDTQIIGEIDRILVGAGFLKKKDNRWTSPKGDVAIYSENHPQTGIRLFNRVEMKHKGSKTIGNITLPPIVIEATQYWQIMTSLKDFICQRMIGKTESIEDIGKVGSDQKRGDGDVLSIEVTKVSDFGKAIQSGSGRGKETDNLRDFIFGKKLPVKAKDMSSEIFTHGDASMVPCGCDYDKTSGKKTKMEYPTVK